jgi:hypothetical protein
MVHRKESFWNVVHTPFIARDLNRNEVRRLIRDCLEITGWSYKRLLPLLGIESTDYLKFMDFLRHHDLKPLRDGRPHSDHVRDRDLFDGVAPDHSRFGGDSTA